MNYNPRAVRYAKRSIVLVISLTGIARAFAQPAPEHARSREYNVALGVECGHCHSDADFSDSSKPTFDFARRMRHMVAGLTDGALHALGPISCWTCPRGHATPPRIERRAWESIATAHAADFVGDRPGLGLAMAVYSASLGVDCSYCHVTGDWRDASQPAHATVTT